jgi:uncharacterized protein YunC (DUF1805 family)
MKRIPTECGGFVDVPDIAEFVTPSMKLSVEYSKFVAEEAPDGMLMKSVLLVTRNDHLIYTCGGLMIKICDMRGDHAEDILVRILDNDLTASY